MVVTYKFENEFRHILSKTIMYRIKRVFPNGGLDYIVCTKEELERLKVCEKRSL